MQIICNSWKRFLTVALLTLAVAFAQTPASDAPKPDVGNINGAIYTNDFFGLQISIPAQWSVAGEAAKKQLLEKGQEIVKPDDEKTQKAVQDAAQRVTQLLTLSKSPLGTAGPNSSFICLSEQMPPQASQISGRDYLVAMTKLFKYSTIPVSAEGEPQPGKINGTEFFVLDVAYQTPAGGKIVQRYYASVMRGYALVFIVTAFDEQDRKITDEILSSIKFKNQGTQASR
jgi:hypothetical protein